MKMNLSRRMYNQLVVFLDSLVLPEDVVITLSQPKEGLLNVLVHSESHDLNMEKTIESSYQRL
jgi:hypothetical protein